MIVGSFNVARIDCFANGLVACLAGHCALNDAVYVVTGEYRDGRWFDW